MNETPEIVAPGTRIYAASGQFLEVTDFTAVGMHGKLYQTKAWAAQSAANNAAWECRSWWRKLLNIAPKGYERLGEPAPSMVGLLGSLFP